MIEKEYAMESLITSSIQLPGVKVNRNKFLAEIFAADSDSLQEIIEKGPIAADISQEQLAQISKRHILKRTSQSSAASFTAGLPGGFAMAATIPADVLQFFGMSLRLAQELSYLYGAQDLWENGEVSEEKVQSQLILYFGVMFGVSGAISGVRVLTTQVAKTTLKKLPQKALTKTFWYPIVKQVGKAIGVKVTKTTVAEGLSKTIPIIGGVISGTLNFASMMPMAERLQSTLEKACFNYSDAELVADIETIENAEYAADGSEGATEDASFIGKLQENVKTVGSGLSSAFGKIKSGIETKTKPKSQIDLLSEDLKKLAELRDSGIITQEEFAEKKKAILAKL